MGREELTDDGGAKVRPAPPRLDGRARYGDRFRPTAAPDSTRPRTAQADDADRADTVDLGVEAPVRSWPTWLTRGAAGVGLIATAVVAVMLGDQGVDPPAAEPDAPPELTRPLHDPPPVADLDVSRIEAELWESNGFSYEVTLINRTDTAFGLVDVGPTMSGTELAWDRSLVLPAGRSTTVRIDFLVLNCLAATTSAAPAELRMVVRGPGDDAVAALAQVATVDQAAIIDAAGKDICARGGGDVGGMVLG